MKTVLWIDDKGYKHRSMIRDNDPDSLAPSGIPCDPPDLNRLDWEELKRQLHNMLVEKGLATWEDVQQSQNGVTTSVVSIFKRPLIGLFRSAEENYDN